MSKVICEICGSVYQDTNSEVCPICGWSHNVPVSDEEAALTAEEYVEETVSVPGKKSHDIFDYDAVNGDEDEIEENEDEVSPMTDDEEYEETPKTNPFLAVLLVLIILALLATSGYIFVKYFMPNSTLFGNKETTVATEAPTETTESVETEAPTVPCTGLSITSGKVNLTREGQFQLINVVVTPEDTTDVLTYESEDESIVTVDADGTVTAVAEGETNIIVKCGYEAYTVPVLVLYVEDLTPPTETEAPTETVAETEEDEQTGTSETAESGVESTEVPTETKAPDKEIDPNVVLKIKGIPDRTIGRQGVYIEIELDCGLTPDQVEWSTGNQAVATVDNGKVWAIGPGTTILTIRYGEQVIECWIRCVF